MKKLSVGFNTILVALLLLSATVKEVEAQPTVLQILRGDAQETLSPASLVEMGIEKMEQGHFQAAINDFNQALRLEPHLSRAYYYRGIAQRKLENSTSFRDAYVQALEMRGIARLQLGDCQGAIADLTYVLSVNPDSSRAYLNRGLARLELGRTNLARADFDKARTLTPTFAYRNNTEA